MDFTPKTRIVQALILRMELIGTINAPLTHTVRVTWFAQKDRIEIEDALAGRQLYAKLEDKGLMGIFGQNGQTGFVYKFELTAHNNAFDATASMKFSHEHQNPLFIAMSTGPENG